MRLASGSLRQVVDHCGDVRTALHRCRGNSNRVVIGLGEIRHPDTLPAPFSVRSDHDGARLSGGRRALLPEGVSRRQAAGTRSHRRPGRGGRLGGTGHGLRRGGLALCRRRPRCARGRAGLLVKPRWWQRGHVQSPGPVCGGSSIRSPVACERRAAAAMATASSICGRNVHGTPARTTSFT